MPWTRHLLVFLISGIALIAGAAEQNTAPITVEADRLELDQQKGTSVYEGNVSMRQQSLLLKAERLELHSKEGRLLKAVADGSPVHLERREPQTDVLTRAEASHMEYSFDTGLLEMTGNAHLWRGGDEFSGKQLTYDTSNQVVRAFGDQEQSGDGRVRVILQPEKESGNE
jgi:lipopolysaccharide export system protein LptA